jgi:hypothetical protein
LLALNGLKATTHWLAAEELARRYPAGFPFVRQVSANAMERLLDRKPVLTKQIC